MSEHAFLAHLSLPAGSTLANLALMEISQSLNFLSHQGGGTIIAEESWQG